MTTIMLQQCLDAPGQALDGCLVAALKDLPPGSLPLGECCNQGGLADDSTASFSVLAIRREPRHVVARVGVFFIEVIGGCSCHDDPVRANAYCLIEVAVRRSDGQATVTPLEA